MHMIYHFDLGVRQPLLSLDSPHTYSTYSRVSLDCCMRQPRLLVIFFSTASAVHICEETRLINVSLERRVTYLRGIRGFVSTD